MLTKSEAQAIFVSGAGTAVVDGITAMTASGSTVQFVTLPSSALTGFLKLLKGLSSAKAQTEGLRRAGADPTPEKT